MLFGPDFVLCVPRWVIAFSDEVVKMPRPVNPRDSVMTNAQYLASLPSGGTACSAPLRHLNAQKAKGEGDAKASAIFAEAFGKDPQFAAFYRSLEAYRASFRSRSDVVVVDPSSDFFRAMRGSSLAASTAPRATPPAAHAAAPAAPAHPTLSASAAAPKK